MKEVKNNKSNIIIVFLIAVMLVVFAFFYIYEKGNPLDANKLNKESDLYLQQTYPDLQDEFKRTTDAYFIRADISYFDKASQTYIPTDGSWQVYYTKTNQPDTYIYFVYDKDKNMIYDSCSDRYLKGAMIYEKLEQEYSNFIKNIFTEEYNNGIPKHSTSLETVMNESHADADFMYHNNHISHIEPYSGPVLDITQEYTMEELANEYGQVYFRFNDGISYNMNQDAEAVKESYRTVVDNLYNRCLEVKEIVTEYKIPFKNISITHGLFEGVFNITYEQLFSDNLYQFIYGNYTII